MEKLDLADERLLEAELSSGEKVLWTGRPNPRIIFHAYDWYLIPFSLLWGGFAIFWETGVTREGWTFGTLWGIPFVVIGQYGIWGRFLYAAWKKKRILYAITNERVIVIVRAPGAKVITSYLRSVPGIDKSIRSDGIGTLKFGDPGPIWGRSRSGQMDDLYLKSTVPVFVDIDEADVVAELVNRQLRNVPSNPAG